MKDNFLDKSFLKLIILGDPHLPGRLLDQKAEVIDWVNSQSDVDLVVVLGDVCATYGTKDEFEFASNFLGRIKHPLTVIAGNHDNYYSDEGFVLASKQVRLQKLENFKKAFNNSELFFAKDFDIVKMIFLAMDKVDCPLYASISDEQIQWLKFELSKESEKPVIVFCHSPLWSEQITKNFPEAVNFMVQPENKFAEIIANSPQVKLWVSGHVHFAMIPQLLEHPVNLYNNRVLNLLNVDMNGYSVLDESLQAVFHDTIWTRTLYLSSDGFSTCIYNHKLKRYETHLEKSQNYISSLK